MNTITSTVNDTFKSFSITGNHLVDTLIITSLVPVVIAYMNGILNFVKSLVGQFFTIIIKYLKMVIKARTIGNLLCKIKLEDDNELFPLVRNTVFDENVESDISGESVVNFLYDEDKEENEEGKDKNRDNSFKKWYERKFEIDKTLSLNKNYTGQGGYFRSVYNYGLGSVDNKIFKYGPYLFKFTMKTYKYGEHKNDSRTEIIIDIMTYKTVNKKHETKKYVDILEEFLKDRFKLENSMYYVYRMKIVHKGFANLIESLLERGFLNPSSGLLKYGDNSLDKYSLEKINENQLAKNEMMVNLKVQNISDTNKNFSDKFELFDAKNSIDTSMGFYFLFKKYISHAKKSFESYGFFVKDGMLYFIIYDSGYQIFIVSFGNRIKESELTMYLDDIRRMALQRNPKQSRATKKFCVKIFKMKDQKWKGYMLDKRDFSTIYLPESEMNSIKFEIDKFLHNEQFYKKLEIPYKKGILFYGPPGTGKTSLVKALAYEYQMNIFMINVNDDEINDDTIVDLLNSLGGGKKILLFEDIDTAFADKERVKIESKYEEVEDKTSVVTPALDSGKDNKNETNPVQIVNNRSQQKRKYLTYSGLLNALDGVLSNQHGVVTIMTTNYIEKLGPAFLRPGRIDARFRLGECNKEQIVKMTNSLITRKLDLMKECINDDSDYNDFVKFEYEKINEKYNEKTLKDKIDEFAFNVTDDNDQSKIKPCELQQYLLSNIDEIDGVFKNYNDLLNE